jgi:hypothetical protein
MKLDVLGLLLHDGLLYTLGAAPGSGLWASLGRREAELCRIFASAYPSRLIQHYSAKTWQDMATSGGNPGAFLLNLDLDIAPLVVGYATAKDSFCMAGLYMAGGRGMETLLTNLPADVFHVDLLSVNNLTEPLRLISASKSVRLVISLTNESLGQPGNLRGVRL